MSNKKSTKILQILENTSTGLTAAQISQIGNFSGRTVVSKYLRQLKEEEQVVSWRSGKNIFYSLSDKKIIFHQTLHAKGLEEDQVWTQIAHNPTLNQNTSENARGILYFAFTEMLNNAIDHSQSKDINIYVAIDKNILTFTIHDFGIGVFRNILTNKHLPDEITSIQELMKGKTTTAPKAHSGEGIYWTSKIADEFKLSSYGYELIVNNLINDYTIKTFPSPTPTGTKVSFTIDSTTNRSLEKFFNKYMSDDNDYAFNTTEIQIKLYQNGEIWISRSQAKRILAGLERYSKIILNFSGIELVGQAFCDEIFRVFRINHPDIVLEPIHMNKSVEIMVKHTLKDITGT